MKDFIKKRLKEDLEYYHADGAGVQSDEFKIGIEEGFDKFAALEMDLRKLVEKHQEGFADYPGDTYGVIDAMNQVMNQMFQRV